jgi:lipopolysaccharide transport system permease protein
MNDIIIITNKSSKKQKLKELWRYKEVLYFLAWKDIIVRYKQTVLGVMWALIQPIVSMVIMTFIFGNIAKFDSGGVPYPVMVFTALIPWNFFSGGMSSVSNSLVGNSNLITKIYFPRITLPISSLITACIDSFISLLILTVMMIGFMYAPPVRILLLPLFYLLVFIIVLGTGIFFATLNVKYRDIRYLVPFILQFGMYISPVGYSISVVPEKYKLLYSINPLVGVIQGFRWCFIPNAELYWPALIISVIFGVVLLLLGIKFFNKFESSFADFI